MSSREWKEVKFEDIADIVMGQSPKGETCNNNGNGVPLLNGPTEFGSSYPTAVQWTQDARKQSIAGDILFCVRGSTTGRMNWSDTNYAIGRGLAAIRHKKGRDYNYFVKAILDYKLDEILASATGSTFPNVGKDILGSLKILVPLLPEQKAIAATLSCLDDMIEVNNRTNQVLEEIAQAIFKRWFVDFEFPNEDGEPYKSSGGEMVDSELGEIPKGWRTGCVNEICKVIYGAPFKSSLFNNVKDGWPLIRIRDLKTYNPQFYTNEHNPRTEFVQPGDILVGMDAEFRPCIWKGDKGVLNQRVCKFEPRLNEVCRFFIYSIIKPHLEFIEGYKVGTTVSHIGKGDIDKIQLIIPTNKALIMFKNTVEPLYVTIINNCKENRILENIRDTLLPKLMSGEIRVPVEEVV